MKTIHLNSPISELLQQPYRLLRQAISAGLPTAIWRLPKDNQFHLIIDLKPEQAIDFSDLESLPAGFAVNPFHAHHPAHPSFIKSDIHLTWNTSEEHKVELIVDPTIADHQIEVLVQSATPTTQQHTQSSGDESSEIYQSIVEAAVEAIREHQFGKVVLSRYEDQSLPEGFDLTAFFKKACSSYSNAFVYILHSQEFGTWAGATPETLLSQNELGIFKTVSLAGTQRLDDKSLSDVAWTQKEIEEQAMVSRYIIDCFKKIRLREYDEIGPRTVQAGNLAHLKTEYIVDTLAVGTEALASTMLHLLHPTSAVCGMPLEPALDFIKKHEHYDRELYAGFIGPVNIDDQINLFVNLRCMKLLENEKVRFFAGAGITEDSNPEKEFIETQMKMNTLKRLMFA